jgi:iduronate 2-sulfatase
MNVRSTRWDYDEFLEFPSMQITFDHGTVLKFRSLALHLSWWVVLAGLCWLPNAAQSAEPPNVLLICVDDLKPVLCCYGDPHAKTPHIDRLAARGTLFRRAYCNQAVCAPSRNALMTGLRPQTLGVYDLATYFRLARPDAVTLGQHFKANGYQTASLGKIFHTGHSNSDDAESWTVPSFRPRVSQYAVEENGPLESTQGRKGSDRPRGLPTECADVDDDQYADGQIAAEAVRRLSAVAQSGEPFFLAVGFLKPHLPFIAPKRYWDLYDPEALPMPEATTPPAGAPDYAPQFGGELRNYRDMPQGNVPLGEDLSRHLIHGYYAATSYTDAQIGRVLDALEREALAENTLVVLWGDHGWHLGDHGMWCKHTNYEQAARIPLIVATPQSRAAVSDALLETVDLFPTLAELAGLPAPPGLDGRSFAHVLNDPDAVHRDHVIHVYPRGGRLGRAIRTPTMRLVAWQDQQSPDATPEFELYDYMADPLESQNLALERPNDVAALKAILATHPDPLPAYRPERQGLR